MKRAGRVFAWAGGIATRAALLTAIVVATVGVFGVIPSILQASMNSPYSFALFLLFGAVALYAGVLVVMRIKRTALRQTTKELAQN